MANYDLSDPTDIDRMKNNFNNYSYEEWVEFANFAYSKEHKNLFTFNERKMLGSAKRSAEKAYKLSPKQLNIFLSIAQKIEKIQEDETKNFHAVELLESKHYKMPMKHLTLRVAWHDNKWNGSICKDPENNTYCNGFHSLLSERIRKRKDENLADEILHKGKNLKDIDYLPPCFWSINLFGKDPIKVKHDNPAAPQLEPIEETLSAQSMYSWPFAVSFTRSDKEVKESGAYPKNLEETRIPRFTAKIEEGKSIAFMYAKFSNPITEEEQQYLVVGAGIVDKKTNAGDIPHFEPISEIEKIRQKPYKNNKTRNFPSMNWAMQFSFDNNLTVRMPYHEYLEEAEKLEDSAKDGFLDKIKVAITEPELEWCFKYVAMDIGDDETIYVLTKMRKALISCKDDGVLSPDDMEERIEKVDELLNYAWSSRSYFPGFSSICRVIFYQQNEPKFPLEDFYEEFRDEEQKDDSILKGMLENPMLFDLSKKYKSQIYDLKDKLEQFGLSIDELLTLSMLNLKPFQFERVLDGTLRLPEGWIRDFDNVKSSHQIKDIIENPYLLYEDYQYWSDSHDDVYGEELDAPIDLFKIDIAFFPDTRFVPRINIQRKMKFVDKRRVRALVLRYLNTLENIGDCFTSAEILQNVISNYPLYYDLGESYKTPAHLFYPLNAEYANHFKEEPAKLVLVEANDTMYYYLANVYNAEKKLEQYFLELLRSSDNTERYPNVDKYIKRSLSTLEKKIGSGFDTNGFDAERRFLFENVYAKKIFIISGSAGSGKSYEVLKILKDLERREGQKYLLLAPTGKAALRLSSDKDNPNIEASTIDKFITDVKHSAINKATVNQYQNIVIDESSMVDLLKFERLLSIFNFKSSSFKRLILIGDPNQLPAIGYGRVLADLINYLRLDKTYQNNFIQLETNCRSELVENDVLRLAEAFKVNVKDDIDGDLKRKFERKENIISTGFRARYWSNKEELYSQIREEFLQLSNNYKGNVGEKLNQILGLTASGDVIDSHVNIENFQILSPYRSQYSGASKINDYIQSDFKKLKYDLRRNIYKQADKLIRTQNYYEDKKLKLSNGTLGFIKKEGWEEYLYYESQDGMEKLPFKNIRGLEQEAFELAYAITIHKSQGSGFNHLFLVLPSRYGLLSKELVYTALTRTKKSITIFIQTNASDKKSVLERALERSFSASRKTSLMLDKPYRFYDLEPESGVFVESRVELLIYHLLMKKRDNLGKDKFDFAYEEKPIINSNEINIKTDFTIYVNDKIWYLEHLGLLSQRKYAWTWSNLKTKTYQDVGIWDNVITTDERNGINPTKIEALIDNIIKDTVTTEDKYDQYSNHHFYLR